MAMETPKLPQTTKTLENSISTPMQTNPQNSRRSKPRVREVSSRFMSPVTRSPVIIPKQVPSTPLDTHISKNSSIRRSNTDFRSPQLKYGDENQHENMKPRAVVKLFKEGSRTDTLVPVVGSMVVPHRSWGTAASKLLQASVIVNRSNNDDGLNDNNDCVSVKSEPIDHSNSNVNNSNNCMRVLTPCTRSVDLTFTGDEKPDTGGGGGNMSKVARSLNLPPMPPGPGCPRPQRVMLDGKKMVVRKGGLSQIEDVLKVKLLYNHYLQWRFANAKAEACLNAQKMTRERELYSLAVKISELQDSVKSKRVEVRLLKEAEALSTILETQMPCLDEWSFLEEAFSSSLLELIQGLQNISSQLPLIGNVKADVKEINEAMNSAMKVAESICSQVQGFVPKAEQVDVLISDLARVHSGEVTLVQECGDLLSKTQLSLTEECSLRGQLMQFQKCKFNGSKEG